MKVGNIPSKFITCADVCLEKDGKHSKGIFAYTYFLECDGVAKDSPISIPILGVAKPKEGKEKNGETGDEKKDLEGKKDVEDKAEKEEKKKAARQRRMRRYRF